MYDSPEEVRYSSLGRAEEQQYSRLAEDSPILESLLLLLKRRGWDVSQRDTITRRLTNTTLSEEGVRVDLIYKLTGRHPERESRLNVQWFFVGPGSQVIAFHSTETMVETEKEGLSKINRIRSIFSMVPWGIAEYDWGGNGLLDVRPYDREIGGRLL